MFTVFALNKYMSTELLEQLFLRTSVSSFFTNKEDEINNKMMKLNNKIKYKLIKLFGSVPIGTLKNYVRGQLIAKLSWTFSGNFM